MELFNLCGKTETLNPHVEVFFGAYIVSGTLVLGARVAEASDEPGSVLHLGQLARFRHRGGDSCKIGPAIGEAIGRGS